MTFDIIATDYRGQRQYERFEAPDANDAQAMFADMCEKAQPIEATLWHLLDKIDEFPR